MTPPMGAGLATRAGWLRASVTVLYFNCLLCLSIWMMLSPSLKEAGLLPLFIRHADTRASGIGAEEYPALAEAVSGFLSGRLESAQVQIAGAEGKRSAFSEDELTHLGDVRGLVDLARLLKNLGFSLLSLSLFLLAYPASSRFSARIGLLAWASRGAALMLFGLIIMLTVLSSLNFASVFDRLHRMVFRNDLWKLDPRQDLLIQLMPQAFFGEYSLRALAGIVALLCTVILVAAGVRFLIRRRTI